ncbi:class I SAM-dependent methyltransferase [Algoriphagus sp. CAU 1675]|uniref:class I SAM-dependent methyltransferase n=1 Tax=Algoriphagus sp. CAU 1675 TaxID=3032597 RepID=UPI0023DC4911|nr:class I SAM-dependent methyltransferase [Algoriphagus sp. CAU 1675]MDF2158549.1 class I SAM-dependent methyltransferase [Algoriphagus sp. CAU 1675]
MKEFWNERYSAEAYAYGTEPNEFYREIIRNLEPGKVLFPAEGEGRNAVFAATLGWDVAAFDLSEEGKAKAEKLAESKGVNIDYRVGTLPELSYEDESFDVVVLIFAHFPPSIRSFMHSQLLALLKPGGLLVLEAFSKDHLQYNSKNPKAGGPKDLAMLYSEEELMQDFGGLEVIVKEEKIVALEEGEFHVGESSVIRFVGKKS